MRVTDKAVEACARNLSRNGFEVIIAGDKTEAGRKISELVLAQEPETVSFGDSLTLSECGTIDWLRSQTGLRLIDGFSKDVPRPELLERRRQALLCDVFLTGINALSMEGSLHWLDMTGNRIAPVAYGPRKVILAAGINKIVPVQEDARRRITDIAAPLNAARHEGFTTPCIKTGVCIDCSSPQRLCNARFELLKCFPGGRITVVLINEHLGL